jgi:hypothetical protein
VRWNAAALGPLVAGALRRYLAVAHFGRGRGQWVEGEAPAFWGERIEAALQPFADTLSSLWASRPGRFDAPGEADRLAGALEPVLRDACAAVLSALYPGAVRATGPGAPGAAPDNPPMNPPTNPPDPPT